MNAPVNNQAEFAQAPLLAKGACAMSVDVEDYFQVWAFSDVIQKESWDGFDFRVGSMTRACLDLFDKHDVKATFFCLGWVAERDPELVREIVARGHELASHGYDHTKVFEQTPEQFREDVSRTKKLLEDIGGVTVNGYRAAGFSINEKTPWAYDALAETGHAYSSSKHPIAHDHYNDHAGSRHPYRPIAGDGFLEAPVATAEIFGRRLSCAGGGWFRAAPFRVSKSLFRRAQNSLEGPAIFYFHPWEIDAAQPRIRSVSLKSRYRHYLNIDAMPRKLAKMLKAFDWRRIDETLGFVEKGEAQ